MARGSTAGGSTERRSRRPGRYGLLALRLLRIDDRDPERGSASGRRSALHQLPHYRPVFADACLPADGPQPSRRRACAACRTWTPASRTCAASCRAPPRTLRRAVAREGLRHLRRPASGTSTPMAQCTAAGPFQQLAASARLRSLSTASCRARPTSSTRSWHRRQPPHRRTPGLPEDGYHVSEDIVDRSIGFVRDQVSLVPERPFFAVPRVRCHPLATPGTKARAPREVPGPLRCTAGTRFARSGSPDSARDGRHSRRARELAPRNPGVKRVGRSSPPNERLFAARLQEAFAAHARPHRRADRSARRTSCDEIESARQHAPRRDVGQRREPGRVDATGVFDEMRWFNGMREDVDAAVRAPR